MASYGHRNKPALYKPTDFSGQQKKAQMRGTSKESKASSEEEEGSGKASEKTGSSDGNLKKVTILKPPQSSKAKSETSTPDPDKKDLREDSTGAKKDQEKVEQKTSKSSQKPAKNLEEKEKPQGVSDKDFQRIRELREFMEKQQLTEKLSNQEKGKEGSNKQDTRPKKEQDKKDSKPNNRNRGNRPNSKGKSWNENQKRGPTGKKNFPAEKKSQQGDSKPKEKSSEKDAEAKPDSTTGTKPKQTTTKSDESNPSKQNTQHRNKDANQGHKKGNNNYHGRNYSNQNKQRLPNNATSILGNPYQQPPSSINLPQHVKQQQQQQQPQPQPQQAFPGPGPTATIGKGNKPHITVPASQDKTEHKRSLDFVKNFFNNDPEVQYHRQKNAEKAAAATATTSAAMPLPQSSLLSSTLSGSMQPNSFISGGGNDLTSYLGNHHHSNHSNQSHGNVIPQSIPMPISMASNYSNLANFYHQSSMTPHNQIGHSVSNTTFSHGASASLQQHQQQQLQQQQHRSSPGSFHSVGHNAIQQTHQQQQRNYDMYSSMNQNTLHHSQPGVQGTQHFPVRSQHATSHANNTLSNNYNMLNSYSNYFHSGGSHVHHVEQQVDPSTISNIIEDIKKPKKWQQQALNKCGPIDSQQARSLIKELIDGTYECMVCCDSIKFNNAVWSCSSCYHVFHLHCIRKWAKSEAASVNGEDPCPFTIFSLFVLPLYLSTLCYIIQLSVHRLKYKISI